MGGAAPLGQGGEAEDGASAVPTAGVGGLVNSSGGDTSVIAGSGGGANGTGGALGTGGVSSVPVVTQVSTGTRWATCARKSDGSVWCWGKLNASVAASAVPVKAAGISNADSVCVGGAQACVRTSDGAVLCWGDNDRGQVGVGTASTDPVAVPSRVSLAAKATAVSCGDDFSCALLETGSVQCWGENRSGQVGAATTTFFSASPITVPMLTGAKALSSSLAHSCAIDADDTVKCWGDNSFGELGPKAGAVSSTAIGVPNVTNVQGVASGYYHSCALRANGTVWCWGRGTNGQLGDGTFVEYSPITQVTGLTNAVAITSGYAVSCAVLADKSLKCWGGLAGDGSSTNHPTPTTVLNSAGLAPISNVAAVSSGAGFACFLDEHGIVSCWGANTTDFANGDPDSKVRTLPIVITGL